MTKAGLSTRLWQALLSPRDMAALVVFRVAFGLLVTISALRFLAYGWVDLFFIRPSFHFTYWGFGWVAPLPGLGMRWLFAGLMVLGLMVAGGLFYRFATACLFVAFTYVQLIDVTTYLNHYYLVSLLAGLLFFIPAHRAYSVDAWRRRPPGATVAVSPPTLPAWCTYLLRFQVGVVYTFAGLAKLTGDWLVHAQPLNLWLFARTDLPLVGPWLSEPWAAYVAAWFGFLFDTTIVTFLLLRKTRALAYAAVIVFHVATSALFPIGMFPIIMMTAALVFFDPAWPREAVRVVRQRFGRAKGKAPTDLDQARGPVPELPPSDKEVPVTRWAWLALWVAVVYGLAQVALPLRTHLYGGNVLWHEQGMRFSWRVMAREKNGQVLFIVRDPATRHEWHVPPSQYVNRIQEREMSVQPDLILQLSHVIARDFAKKVGHPVEVRVDAQASLNTRPSARLIDPTVNLAAQTDGLAPKRWILPAPQGKPLLLASH